MKYLAALALLLAASAVDAADPRRYGSGVDPNIKRGLDHISGSGEDGAAMVEYIRQDRVPMNWGETPPGVAGFYRTTKKFDFQGRQIENRSKIVLGEEERNKSSAEIGELIYHEYVHRAQDESGYRMADGGLGHSEEGYNEALEYVRGRTGGGDVANAPRAQLRRISFVDSGVRGAALRSLPSFNAFTRATGRSGAMRQVRSLGSRLTSRIRSGGGTRSAVRAPVRRVMRSTSGLVSRSRGVPSGAAAAARGTSARAGRTFRAAY
ncbi:MAG: hypothetical protein ABIJ96_06150 [Elusimicrobiota bacterium]